MKDGFRKLALKIELLNEDSLTLREELRPWSQRIPSLSTT
jgi:hypothetical protein